MAVTYEEFTTGIDPGDTLTISVEYLTQDDVVVYADGVETTEYTWSDATHILLGAEFPAAETVRVESETKLDDDETDDFAALDGSSYLDWEGINATTTRLRAHAKENRNWRRRVMRRKADELIGAGKVPIATSDGSFIEGPSAADITAAQGYAEDAQAAAASSSIVTSDDTDAGVARILSLLGDGTVVRAFPAFVNVKDYGAKGDGTTDDTTAVNAAKTALRNAGGGTLYFPPGTFLIDSLDWDYMAGGTGKFVLQGSGSGTTLKKRVDDDATFVTIGRDDTTNTFNGVCVVKDICIDGISGGGETVLSLWTLTTTSLSNVRVRYGTKAVSLTNCVTVVGLNVVGASSGTGLFITQYVFGDTTTSAANLLTFIGGAFKDCTTAGIDYNASSELVLVGTQVENNGTAANTSTAGVFIRNTAGDAGVYRKAVALTALGVWFENNKGLAAVVLSGGTNSFTSCHFVANADATRDLYSNGGLYTLLNCSMPTGRTNGPIEDASGSVAGNLILGGELSGSGLVDETKTDILSANIGTAETPTRVFRRKGKTFMSSSGTTELMIQTGTDSQASGSTVTFPTAFSATPVFIALTVMGNASNKIINAKAYNLTSTGFTIEKTSMTSGSNTISTTSDTVRWMAIGAM